MYTYYTPQMWIFTIQIRKSNKVNNLGDRESKSVH